jgi:hypothetical protein
MRQQVCPIPSVSQSDCPLTTKSMKCRSYLKGPFGYLIPIRVAAVSARWAAMTIPFVEGRINQVPLNAFHEKAGAATLSFTSALPCAIATAVSICPSPFARPVSNFKHLYQRTGRTETGPKLYDLCTPSHFKMCYQYLCLSTARIEIAPQPNSGQTSAITRHRAPLPDTFALPTNSIANPTK